MLFNAYALRIEQHRYGAAYLKQFQDLRAQERWSPEQVERRQSELLKQVVEAAYLRSPYYRARMDEVGVSPADVRTVRDIVRLPILDKADVRRHGRELLTHPAPRRGWSTGRTSGTTGSPLHMWYDRNTCVLNNATDRLQKAWAGMAVDDWIGVFLGRIVVSLETERPPFWRVNYVQKQVWFSSFHMSEDNLRAYVEQIRRKGLKYLEGYPSTLYILANYLQRSGIHLPMKAVFTSSETLHPMQREVIEAAFGCEIYDFYGMAERVIFAMECEHHDGKHLVDGYGYTEVVDADGNPVPDGQRGFLVGTSLHNLAMPMIRYRTSDVSAIRTEPCPCGRTMRRMEPLVSRREDIILTPSGRIVSPGVLTAPFKQFPQIALSQIVQESPEHFAVSVVAHRELGDAEQQLLLGELRERLGAGVHLTLAHVDDIPREPSGKFRWFVSRVPHAYRIDWEEVAA